MASTARYSNRPGAETIEAAEPTPYAFRYRLRYSGDTRQLAHEIEQIEGAEVLSFGSALELIKDLGDALAALEKDDVIRSAMPGEMYRLYDEYKRDEWERFMATVTEWDVKTYLDCLP